MRIAAGIFAAAAVIAVILSLFAFDQRNQAEEQRVIADEQRMVAETERERADEQRMIAVDAMHVAEINERKNLSLSLAANARTALSENDPALALPVAIAARHAFDPPEAEVLRILGRSAFSPGPRYRFTESPRSILGVDISADGALSAYAGTEGVIYFVSTSSGESLGSIETGSPISAVAFSPDGARIAAALADATVGVWTVDSGEAIHRLSGHESVVSDVEFSPDGTTLASSSADTTVRLWDAASGAALHTLQAHVDYVIKLSFSPDGARLASASSAIGIATSDRTIENNTVQIWDVASGENTLTIPPEGPGYYRDVEFSPDGRTVAASTWSSALGGNVRIFDAETGEQVQRIYAHRENIPNIEFAPDGSALATAATDASIKIWNIELAVSVASYVDFGLAIQDIEYTPAGDYMLVALGGEHHFPDGSDSPANSAAILWDLQNRAQSQAYTGHTDWSWATDISPDGRLIASGSGPLRFPASIADLDATVRVWDAETGEQLHVLEGHENTVDSVKFLADSQQLLSSSWDGTIRRWDLNEGIEIQRYEVADERVYMVELMPDGAQICIRFNRYADPPVGLGDRRSLARIQRSYRLGQWRACQCRWHAHGQRQRRFRRR